MSEFDLKSFLKSLSSRPGVYRMLGEQNQILYVGKAKNLKARVSSYFSGKPCSAKQQALVKQIANIEITITETEAEALLLECNLIKTHKPRFNILLRDDKSYPYIYISTQHQYPRLAFHRGSRQSKGKYYGPYPSAYAVRYTLSLLQKLFRIRQCEDSFFKSRSRPCLQYQIKRCTAPCVAYINEPNYRQDIKHAELFLQGKSDRVVKELIKRMDKASNALEYELAAEYRDQIANLQRVQERDFISSINKDYDIIACASLDGLCCIQVFFIRNGRNLGNKAFYPKLPQIKNAIADNAEILTSFIGQYYLDKYIPKTIIVSDTLSDHKTLETALTQHAGSQVSIVSKAKSNQLNWVKNALSNAEHALSMQLASKQSYLQKFERLQDALNLESLPERIECFDVSHTSGEATVASCVVFDVNGPLKTDYRRYNIKTSKAGDDYAAMHEALTRRYTRLKKGEAKLPDVLFIDGGKGQVKQAIDVLETLQIDGIAIVGVAKGPERIAGQETLIVPYLKKSLTLPATSHELHLIQQIRDEAHRFAISGHRLQRAKKRQRSILEDIPGLGPKRRQQILKQFGGIQGMKNVSISDLAKIKGVSQALARQIHDKLHD